MDFFFQFINTFDHEKVTARCDILRIFVFFLMNNLVLSTACLPPVEYFARIQRAGRVLVEAHENYSRQTYRNRCVIAGPNGLQSLIVPVLHGKGEKVNIRDVRIDYSSRWQQVHLRSVEAAYNKSPFFAYYRDSFEPIWFARHRYLFDLNMEWLERCLELLGITTVISLTTSFQKEYPECCDMRWKISPKNRERRMTFPRYIQVFETVHGFAPGLSIIDLLFNRGPQAFDYLQQVEDV